MSAVLAGRKAGGVQRVGRFELKRVLGRGAQAAVWLAHDPRLDREVALKLMQRGDDPLDVDQWLAEARAVSRLTHPHIVPVFEAAEEADHAYLVFEYVAGPTLAQLLTQRGGTLPAREAARMMLGVLDALHAAHASGIVHRDLKPSNILVDAQGRPRVMDFGIAARMSDRHDRRICGSPGYMSPEAARGEAPMPAMDVFAAGMLLGQMLAGAPLLRERDPLRAVERIQHEDMALPQALPAPVDDGLRAIVMRAIARDPQNRHADAAAFHAALAQWLDPALSAPAAAASAHAQQGNGTLDFLLRRMRHKSDFPALSDSVARIQRVANSDRESIASLAGEIMKDVALTNKLLRLVNTAHFSTGGGPVSTVSRAVALVGFAGIRNMALSLVLVEHMQDKSHARQLKEEFLRSLMAGTLASELTAGERDGEEAFLAALFQGLGRLLAEFYFPEEAREIRTLCTPAAQSGETSSAAGEDAAAQRVLGISFEELGLGVARSWGLPDTLQRAMRKPGGELPLRPAPRGTERQRWLAQASGEVADALLHAPQAAERVNRIAARYARVLDMEPSAFEAAAQAAQQRLTQLARAMQLDIGATTANARRLLAAPAERAAHDESAATVRQAPAPDGAEAATLVLLDLQPPAPATEMLAAGIQKITDRMVSDGFRLNEVLRLILQTMLDALGFGRVVFCLRDPKTETLTGRFGLGEGVDVLRAAFKVPLRVRAPALPDLFSAVCLKGVDTLIADAAAPAVAARLPAWFSAPLAAPTFLLLPLSMKGAPFALIYADHPRPGGIVLGEKELNLLRTLRNQAVMAFRQAA